MVELRRRFPGEANRICEMRAFVRDGCSGVWPDAADQSSIAALELAVSEAAGNIILHGLQDTPDAAVELVLTIDPRQAETLFHYPGRAFTPSTIPPPDFSGQSETGFGLYLIQQSVDDVSFSRSDAGICTIRLVKNRR